MFYYLFLVFFLKGKFDKMLLCMSFLFYMCMVYFGGSVESGGLLYLDGLSFSMVFLSLVLMLVVFSIDGYKKHYHLCMGMVVVIMYFLVENLFIFFVLFELSLLPIFFMITSSGSQPERVVAIKYMMIFTLVASSPLLMYILFLYVKEGISLISVLTINPLVISRMEENLVLISMFAFWVKIPMFFFHSWLPKAHVEAPLEGSMILAGLMLKVGMYGMVRVMYMFSYLSTLNLRCFFFSIGLIGAVMSFIIAISSDDMKMSVAFSSISHMNFSLSSLASMSVISIEGWIMVMISHGICSPMMFYLVTKIYENSGSRSMLISKGFVAKFPFFQTMNYLIWSFNISPPPLFSFLGEVSMIYSLFSVYVFSALWIFLYMVLSSFFSMINYGIQNHSSKGSSSKNVVKMVNFASCAVFSLLLMFFFFFFSNFFFV